MKTEAEMIKEMFTIQNGLNTKSYDKAWIEKGKTEEFDYAMAAGDEAHEFARSLPFEWWKAAKPDRQNQVTEIVDAWHFVMSQLIIDYDGNIDGAVPDAVEAYVKWNLLIESGSEKKMTKLFVACMYMHGSQYAPRVPYIDAFWAWCDAANVSLELLYARYIAKATLNKFRVDNGYKVGTYTKMWRLNGDQENHEDNYYLAQFVDDLSAIGVNTTAEEIREWLDLNYHHMLKEMSPASQQ